MRLSSVVFVGILLFILISLLLISPPVVAQHSSGGGGSAGGGGSFHGGSSGFSSAPSSSAGSSASSSHGSSNASGAGRGTGSAGAAAGVKGGARRAAPARTDATKTDASGKPKKGVFSFLRHRKPAPARLVWNQPPARCKKGQNCTQCRQGQVWNGFSCGVQADQNLLFGCGDLARRLAEEREHMQGQSDPTESLRYQFLLNQYQQCLRHFQGQPFSAFAFSGAGLQDLF